MALCERLHCTRHQIQKDDVLADLRDLDLLDLYRDLKRPVKDLSPEANAAVGRALQLEIDYGR